MFILVHIVIKLPSLFKEIDTTQKGGVMFKDAGTCGTQNSTKMCIFVCILISAFVTDAKIELQSEQCSTLYPKAFRHSPP